MQEMLLCHMDPQKPSLVILAWPISEVPKFHRFFVEILSLKLNHCGRFHQNMIGLAAVPCQIETRSGQV